MIARIASVTKETANFAPKNWVGVIGMAKNWSSPFPA